MILLNNKPAETRKVYLLLTKFSDTGTKVIRALTGLKYPHASIGLDEDMNTFYSFVKKGFLVEKINRYVKPGKKAIPCRLYEMTVSEETYLKIKQVLEYFIEFREYFHYSRTSLALSLLNFPYRRNRFGFFCSQFVAFILQRSGAIKEITNVNQYFSDDLSSFSEMRLKYQGNLKNMMHNYCPAPCIN